jgi:hypothetical protein
MRRPRAPGAGDAGAWIFSLGSETPIAPTDRPLNEDRKRSAAILDREADALLQMGQHQEAERRAWRAAELRAGAA